MSDMVIETFKHIFLTRQLFLSPSLRIEIADWIGITSPTYVRLGESEEEKVKEST
jgi:hypothetical protein